MSRWLIVASLASAVAALQLPSASARLPRRAVLAGVGGAAAAAHHLPAAGAAAGPAEPATSVKRFSMYDPKITPLPPFGALSLLEDELFTRES